MNPEDDDLRDLLRRKADQVSTHRELPASLARRARRRIALNALGVSAAVVLLAAGAFAGMRAIQRNTNTPGAFSSSPPSGSSSPTLANSPTPATSPSAATAACTSAQLRAVGTMQGAAGSREGTITFTNFSDKTCTLQGTPTVTLLDGNLHPITSGVTFSSSPPAWQVNGSPKPTGWPVVTVASFHSASVRVRWSNWCPQGRSAPLWRIRISGGGTVDANGMEAVSPPPCNGAGQPSTVERGPFEPTK